MPISSRHPIRRLSQQNFGDIAFNVMRCVFDVHRDLGRLFSEEIYQAEIAHRLGNAICETPIDITFGNFSTTLFLDLLVDGGAIFEPFSRHHLRRLFRHSSLRALHWVNLTRPTVQFKTIN